MIVEHLILANTFCSSNWIHTCQGMNFGKIEHFFAHEEPKEIQLELYHALNKYQSEHFLSNSEET